MKIKFIIIFVVILGACQNVNKAPKPDNLIPEDKMVDILVDLQRLDAVIQKNDQQFEMRNVKAKDLILEKYQVDSLQIANSSNYYAEDFSVNESIYEKVKTILEAEKKLVDSLYANKKTEMEKAKAKKTTVVDSL